ncbi:MAG: trypsin-like peptidase domain-containing protein, partial [Bdellovibrionota bacterium]
MKKLVSLKRRAVLIAAGSMLAIGGVLLEHPAQHPGAFGAAISGPVDANIFVNLSKKVVPSVVNISTLSTVKTPFQPGSPDDILRKFFGDLYRHYNGGGRGGDNGDEGGGAEDDQGGPPPPQLPPGKLPKAMSLGTGFIIDASGLILTNNHVVADADEIKISFTEAADEKPTDGEVVGRDTELDVALIKVKSKREMVPVALGDSDALEVGEYVLAVGNPFGQGHSVTHGIISAKGRLAPDFPLANYLQTDAPINPGNSGGPLVNLKGEVIGINNAIDQRAQGIGFAIPINLVKHVLPQLRTKGTVARGYIGVLVNELTPEIAGKIGISKDLRAPFVTHVYPNEPADKAGIKPYDVILDFAGKPIRSGPDLIAAVTSVSVGEAVPVKISRAGKPLDVTIKVSQRPGTQQLAHQDLGSKKKSKKNAPVETGMTLEDVTPEVARDLGMNEKTSGVVVSSTTYGGPADKAGLRPGDVILEFDGRPVTDPDQFVVAVRAKSVGETVQLTVRRG